MRPAFSEEPVGRGNAVKACHGGKLTQDALKIRTMAAVARETGLTVDFLDQLTVGLSKRDFLKVMSNASGMPSYMKSNDSPYVFRSARAPANPT